MRRSLFLVFFGVFVGFVLSASIRPAQAMLMWGGGVPEFASVDTDELDALRTRAAKYGSCQRELDQADANWDRLPWIVKELYGPPETSE